jgi:hypothetical protein
MHARAGKIRDERMPKSMEIGHEARAVSVRDSRRFQVAPKHLRRVVAIGHVREDQIIDGTVADELRKRLGQLPRDRLHILSPMLAVGRLNDQDGRITIVPTGSNRQRTCLSRTQAGFQPSPRIAPHAGARIKIGH